MATVAAVEADGVGRHRLPAPCIVAGGEHCGAVALHQVGDAAQVVGHGHEGRHGAALLHDDDAVAQVVEVVGDAVDAPVAVACQCTVAVVLILAVTTTVVLILAVGIGTVVEVESTVVGLAIVHYSFFSHCKCLYSLRSDYKSDRTGLTPQSPFFLLPKKST